MYCTPYIMDSLSFKITRQRSVRRVNQTHVFGSSLQLLGRTSASHGFQSGIPQHWSSLWPQGTVPPSFKPLQRGCVDCMVPEALLFRGMPTGLEVFLKMPGTCGLRPFVLKRPCVVLAHSVGRATNTVNQTHVFGAPLKLLGRTSGDRGVNCTVQVGCTTALEFLLASGGRPPGL